LLEDVTSMVQSEQALELERAKMLQSSKLATLGEMAGGVAHEINNPLTIIIGKCRMAEHMLDKEHPNLNLVRETLKQVQAGAYRIHKIVHGLSTFTRVGEADPMVDALFHEII